VALTPEDVQSLIAAFEASEWDEMTLSVDGTRLALSRSGRPPAGAQVGAVAPAASDATAPETAVGARSGVTDGADAAAPPVASAPPVAASASPGSASPGTSATSGGAAEGALRITAPSVGLFWRSPQPGAPHFVDVGQTVGPDDTVCIVEVMKLMNHVKAGITGVVRSVEVENGAMVEHGQVLFVLDPAS
jgi:acetyl-CoA carboxylase biotin carboxyl carrier protein